MKKLDGQADLIDDNLPELKDEEIAEKLERIWKLREGAKMHDKLERQAKEQIGGWVLGLPKKDQKAGALRCGDFEIPFGIKDTEPEIVDYTTKGGKKVRVKFAPDKEDDE